MGSCIFCGKPAGLFKSAHSECEGEHRAREQKVQGAKERVVSEVRQLLLNNDAPMESLEKQIAEIEDTHSIPVEAHKQLLIRGWIGAAEDALEKGVLSLETENRIFEFRIYFDLDIDLVNKNGTFDRLIRNSVLGQVLRGEKPAFYDGLRRDLPVNFLQNETLIWGFPDSDYLEDKIKRQYVGQSQGVSVRLMKGLYYRVGSFKGHSIEYRERVLVGKGLVVVTTKNIYFVNGQTSVRVPYEKIVSFIPFDDGIGVIRDGASAKPQIFMTGDGWYIYNLVTNLAQMPELGEVRRADDSPAIRDPSFSECQPLVVNDGDHFDDWLERAALVVPILENEDLPGWLNRVETIASRAGVSIEFGRMRFPEDNDA